MPSSFRQSAFSFFSRPLVGREDFLTADCNAEAVALIDSVPNDNFSAALIIGGKGCGKTHLCHLFADSVFRKTGEKAAFLPEPCLTDARFAVWEATFPFDEEALFHLLNDIRSKKGFLLMTADRHLSAWNVALPDLRTRLLSVPSVEIAQPDEAVLTAVLLKLFADRQLTVAPDVIAYILKHAERSFAAAGELVERADALSLETKKAVSVQLIRKVLNEVSENKD